MKQVAILLIAGAALALPGQAAAKHTRHGTRHAAAHQAATPGAAKQTADTGGTKLSASLTGSAEVPKGDPDATGSFTATINAGHDQLCYELTSRNLDTPTAAHIHQGATGQNGGPVVMLEPPKNGSSQACVSVASDLATKLIQQPQNYYVNVHNAAFPNGGLRGQLSK